ncbi:MAG: VOC family protein [Flavobacterium sp.]|uniref:VOC family protein n=1 Tax=Flavobacterium sp. TaxID=239 RepID=UPI0022C7AB22|nr:VOC family protein [Flavobacterium sp.]MCZ8197094.1 VOC family protein [Flavobacterium sp.]
MERKHFIKGILGTSLLLSMDSISTFANAFVLENANNSVGSNEIASFGAIHLNNTSIEKAISFWTKVIGLKLRKQSETEVEFGTEHKTLVVVHQTAATSFKEGYSGLYHFAIHLPNKAAFAKAIYRLQQNKYSFSPVDHTMTQSLYLTDFDNVMVELAFETPERFKRVITESGLFMEDTDGTIRGASAPLDTEEILKSLEEKDLTKIIDNDAKIGHLHFYAKDVDQNNRFYKKLGFTQSNYFPEYSFADLGAGSSYSHRIAMNSWHGYNKPLAPSTNAGLKHYQIVFNSKEQLLQAVMAIDNVKEKEVNYWATDPTGIEILLTHNV